LVPQHFAVRERLLITAGEVAALSGHPGNIGMPREAFIREFLVDHLPERLAIGQGEVIDANSVYGQARPQVDVVLYLRDFPRIPLGGGVAAHFVESVVATIEVKSRLTRAELNRAIAAAQRIKQLQRNLHLFIQPAYSPPAVLCYVVAYDGPARPQTTAAWIARYHADHAIVSANLPPQLAARLPVASPHVDGVFVLGKHFVLFDNTPMGITIPDAARAALPQANWLVVEQHPTGGLFTLFMLLTIATSAIPMQQLKVEGYLANFAFGHTQLAATP